MCYRFRNNAEEETIRPFGRTGTTATLSFHFGAPKEFDPLHAVYRSPLAEFTGGGDPGCRRCTGVDVLVQPWAVGALLGRTGREFALGALPVRVRDSGLHALLRAMSGAADWSTRLAVLDTTLLRRWERGVPVPPPVRQAWEALSQVHGTMPISRIAAASGWSHRQLSRRFAQELGVPPKAAARVLRLHRALRLLASGVPGSRVAAECDFYDQAHLSRECRALTGLSPRQWGSRWADMAISSNTGGAGDGQYQLVGFAGSPPEIQTEEDVEETTVVYEAPALVEVGEFSELTQLTSQGYWLDSPFGAWWF